MRISSLPQSAIRSIRVLISVAVLISAAVVLAADDPHQAPKVVDKASLPISVAEIRPPRPINFAKDVLPIFRSNCVACHNAKESKGGLVLETPKSIRAGGESGPAAVPGKSDQSPLIIAAAHREKPFMPPRNNKVSALPLTGEQLGVLKLWIDQGAGGDETLRAAPIQWRSLPPILNPIYSVALSSDGQYVVCSRANQIFVYDLPARRLVTRLTDPSLAAASNQLGIAHRDLVQSLAFSPDGRTLASGGYREVKFWSRPEPTILVTLKDAHAKGPNSLMQSPNGKTLAVIGDDNTIRLFGLPSGKLLRELKGHTAPIIGIGFAEGGAKIISGSMDKTLRIWPTAAGGEATVIETRSAMTALAVLGNGQIVTGSEKFLRIWEDGKQAREIPITYGPVTMLAPADDAARFVVAGKDGTLRIYDAATGKATRQLNAGAALVAMAMRSDGKRLAVVGNRIAGILSTDDTAIQIPPIKGDRDAMEAVKLCERRVTFANGEVVFAKAMVDDATKRQASEAQAITQATAALAAADKAMADAKKTAESTVAAQVKADKALAEATAQAAETTKSKEAAEQAITAATAAPEAFRPKRDKARELADAAPQGDQRKTLRAAQAEVQKSYDDLKAKADKATQARDAILQKIPAAAERTRQADSAAKQAAKTAVEADSASLQAQIAYKSARQSLAAFKTSLERAGKDLVDGKAEQKVAEALVVKSNADLTAAQNAATTAGGTPVAVAFTADGGTLLTAGGDDCIRAWSAETGLPALTLRGPAHAHAGGGAKDAPATGIVALAAGPQGILAAAGADGDVQIWNLAGEWKLARTIGAGSEDSPLIGRVCSLAFSPDGSILATGGGVPSRTGELKLWSAADGKLIREIVDAHSDTVLGLSFSADGKYLASCAADKFAKVFSVADGKIARSFEGHTEHVLGISFRYDGRALITGGADNGVRFWNMITGEQKPAQQNRPYTLQVTSVNYVGFSDTALVTVGDGTVHLVTENGSVRNFEPVGTFIYCGAVTADGQTIAVGGHDSVLRVWQGREDRAPTKFEPPVEGK